MMVKICGITNREDAIAAAAAGATALGFNFYPPSPRYITPEAAAGIGAGINLIKVGIFVNEESEFVAAAMEDGGARCRAGLRRAALRRPADVAGMPSAIGRFCAPRRS